MTHASVFSGIGGPEIAAAMLGWENLFHCEINPFGRTILNYWFPNSKSYEDITKTSFKEWRGKVDVLSGGFPCQPFSYAGKRRGADDDRYLWPQMLRVIQETRPSWVVGENVAGITTMVEGGEVADMECQISIFREDDDVHRYQFRQSYTIERVCKDIESCGYSVQPVLIPAAAVGAPHRRNRVFIIACSDTLYDGCGNAERGLELHGGGHSRERNDTIPQPWEKKMGDAFPGFPRDYEAERRWRNFPTVSPLFAGDDGFPEWLDRDSLPDFWYKESLKAYGNAIVPQVIYEIFKAIEEVSK